MKNGLSLGLSIIVYLLFNLRMAASLGDTLVATAGQLLQTAPFVAGVTYALVALLQAMAGGARVPWERRLRLFLAVGILGGLVMAIYEYAGPKAAV